MLKKIPTKDLKIGMFVADVGRSWFNHPWASKSKNISCQEEISKLLDYGITEVTVDTEKTLIQSPAPPQATAPVPPPAALPRATAPAWLKIPENQTDLDAELPKAFKSYQKGLDTSKALWTACRINKKIELEEVKESVGKLVESVTRHQGALTTLIKLRQFDDYTYTHSLNVSVLAISMANSLKMDQATLHLLGLGTMFHDLGKTKIPGHILHKPGKLTDEEFAVMRNHPALGQDIIGQQKLSVSPEIVDIVRHHHEKADGSGYPDALAGEKISTLATICALSDVYDALTSDRVYHKGMALPDALKIVYNLRGSHFKSEWADKFVQCMGIYPTGTIVELTSGQVAVVAEVNPKALTRPIIKVVAEANGQLRPRSKLMDMSENEAIGIQIKRIISKSEAGFDPAFYFNLEPPK